MNFINWRRAAKVDAKAARPRDSPRLDPRAGDFAPAAPLEMQPGGFFFRGGRDEQRRKQSQGVSDFRQNLPENNVGRMQLPEDRFPISAAYLKMLNRRVPGDPQRRTYVELIAEVMVYRALKGDVRAATELREATGVVLQSFIKPWRRGSNPFTRGGRAGM